MRHVTRVPVLGVNVDRISGGRTSNSVIADCCMAVSAASSSQGQHRQGRRSFVTVNNQYKYTQILCRSIK